MTDFRKRMGEVLGKAIYESDCQVAGMEPNWSAVNAPDRETYQRHGLAALDALQTEMGRMKK